MTRFAQLLGAGLLLIAWATPSLAQRPCFYDKGLRCETAGGKLRLLLLNRGQVRFTFADPEIGDSKASFDIARYKLSLEGGFAENWEFRVQSDLANGSETSSELLEDLFFVYTKQRLAQVWIGQGKVPFGRQELNYSDSLQFVDRSLATERFAHGRDVGLSVFGLNKKETYSYSIGIYNGNGINKDEGDNIDNLVTARLVFTPFGRFDLDETPSPDATHPKLAIGISGMRNTVGTEGFEEERVERGGLELAFQTNRFSFVAEFFTESADITLGAPREEVDTDGWYAQLGYLFAKKYEIAARFSEILRDVDDSDAREVGLAFNYYFERHRRKVQADYTRIEFDAVGDQQFIDRDVFRVQAQFIF